MDVDAIAQPFRDLRKGLDRAQQLEHRAKWGNSAGPDDLLGELADLLEKAIDAEREGRVRSDTNLQNTIATNKAAIEQALADEIDARWRGDNNLSAVIVANKKSADEARAQADSALSQLQLVQNWATDVRQKLADKGIIVAPVPNTGHDVAPH